MLHSAGWALVSIVYREVYQNNPTYNATFSLLCLMFNFYSLFLCVFAFVLCIIDFVFYYQLCGETKFKHYICQ